MNTSENVADRRASEVLFDETINSRNSLRRSNMEAIKTVCDQMERDSVPMSAAEVVRRCGPDGPAYSTVSNKGSALGEYIRLRIVEQSARLKQRSPGENDIASLIRDPVLQARVKDLEARIRWIEKENKSLRTLFKTLDQGIDIDNIIAAGPSPHHGLNLGQPANHQQLPPQTGPHLATAILTLMSHLISERGYEVYRERLCINRKQVLPIQELKALREASGLEESTWQNRFTAQNLS